MHKYQVEHSKGDGVGQLAHFKSQREMLKFVNDLLSSGTDKIIIRVRD